MDIPNFHEASTPGKLYLIGAAIPDTSVATFSIAMSTLLFLIAFGWMKSKLKDRYPLVQAIPNTIIVVAIGILIVWLARLDKYVRILGSVDGGFPDPIMPPFYNGVMVGFLFPKAITIAIVGFVEVGRPLLVVLLLLLL
jgi:MFS superfamily sulfate permease-like transporter